MAAPRGVRYYIGNNTFYSRLDVLLECIIRMHWTVIQLTSKMKSHKDSGFFSFFFSHFLRRVFPELGCDTCWLLGVVGKSWNSGTFRCYGDTFFSGTPYIVSVTHAWAVTVMEFCMTGYWSAEWLRST
jgi:hypothetical protein